MNRLSLLTALTSVAALGLFGCGGGPISVSQPITLSKTSSSNDVVTGVLTWDRGVNNDTGSPFANFIGAARQQLEGKDPSRLELTSASLFLGGQSQGVTALEQVFSGRVDMLLQTSHTSYAAAHLDQVSRAGPADFTVDFNWNAVAPADRSDLFNGNFDVVLRGEATTTFATTDSKADLQTTIGFQAYE
jgi:hypothetical protein